MACIGARAAATEPTLRADGAWVVETGSKLRWARCVEGMAWDGRTCGGTALRLAHPQTRARASALAQAQGQVCRLPRVGELARLAERVRAEPRTAEVLFPQAPSGAYWTASVTIDTSPVNPYNYRNIEQGVTGVNVNRLAYLHGWTVDWPSGRREGDRPRRDKLAVRLVCEES